MRNNYHLLSKDELASTIISLREELNDLEETINYNFSNTSAHINGSQVLKDEKALEELKSEVIAVERLLEQVEK